MNKTLLSLFLFMATSNVFILSTQKLNLFDKNFIFFILIIQFIAIHSLTENSKETLYYTHWLYIITLLLGSIVAQNKYIIYLIFAIIMIAKIIVIYKGDCPYHEETERIEFGAGGNTDTYLTDNALYILCIFIILYRFRNKII